MNSRGELIQHLDEDSGLSDLTINYVYEDDQNGLWLATNNGLSRFELNSPFSFIDDRFGLAGSGYTALLDIDQVYLGTNVGLYIFKDNKLSFLEGSEGQVYTIQRVNGHLLMGHQNGTFLIKGNRLERISEDPGTWIFKNLPNQPGLILQGNYSGLSILESNSQGVKFRNKIQGFEESSRLMEIEGDDLWVAHGYKGVYKLKLSDDLRSVVQSRLYNSETGFPRDVLINVFRINNEVIFTAQNGFYAYDKSSDSFVQEERFGSSLQDSLTIVDMESDILGNVYFIEVENPGVLKKQTSQGYEMNTSSFNKIRSQWNDDLANVTVLNESNVLFGGKNGFIHYSPQNPIGEQVPTQVLFKTIRNFGDYDSALFLGHDLLGEGFSRIDKSKFSYAQNSMEFEFIAPHFASQSDLQYQYELVGFDEGWSDWSSDNRKEYTNLREGDYTFKSEIEGCI